MTAAPLGPAGAGGGTWAAGGIAAIIRRVGGRKNIDIGVVPTASIGLMAASIEASDRTEPPAALLKN